MSAGPHPLYHSQDSNLSNPSSCHSNDGLVGVVAGGSVVTSTGGVVTSSSGGPTGAKVLEPSPEKMMVTTTARTPTERKRKRKNQEQVINYELKTMILLRLLIRYQDTKYLLFFIPAYESPW